MTLTLDHSLISLLDEARIETLQGLLCVKNPHVLKGQLLVRNCYSHVVSQLAQDALGAMSETITKIRTSIKYMKTILEESHDGDEKFVKLKQQLLQDVLNTKKLVIDDQSKWDTTYHMLAAACELREVFACSDTHDLDCKMDLSLEE